MVKHTYANGATVTHRCNVVAEFRHPLLLGTDYFRKHGVILDFSTDTCRIPALPEFGPTGGVSMFSVDVTTSFLRVNSITRIPANSVTFVQVCPDDRDDMPNWWKAGKTIK